MTAPFPPRPDRPAPLSAAELRALSAIEDELDACEVSSGERASGDRWTYLRLWVPVAVPGWLALLLVAFLLGVVAASLHSLTGAALLAVFVVMAAAPALVGWLFGDMHDE